MAGSPQATSYDCTTIEERWLERWEQAGLFQGTAEPETGKEPLYLLFAFAYPSGSGLHVGHVESKTALDILARYNRMQGKQVFFPVGWDAFGLPAENYAIKTGVPPAETTRNAIDTFRRQIKRLGISYDWQSEIATSHPGYYRWTQWLFLQLYQERLAYKAEGQVNWCPSCQTVLANEQVVDGLCERCGSEVIQKSMNQWFLRISQYRDELIAGLDQVDWPAATKQQQLNWIGKSEGAVVTFSVDTQSGSETEMAVECFTTRLDTIYGVTFIAMSPEKWLELGLSQYLTEENRGEVQRYVDKASKKTEEQRKIGEKDKSGVATGLSVHHPITGESVPIYVADYILAGYGTGAVMGVPAHDERDYAFAHKHGLKVVEVIQPAHGKAQSEGVFADYGKLINSGAHTDLSSEQAISSLLKEFPQYFSKTTTYKLRDWLISRQRYWGAPIPIVYDPEGQPHPVREEHLPWLLPTDVDFKPTGESPLKSSQEFIERTERLYGKGWRPEFDTMDTFVDSSWYYVRYLSARNETVFADPAQLKHWLPVDFYMIGPEHIVLHLLYSRFFTKFLRDQGYLQIDEPFAKMRHQGMILGPDGKKMSKSKGNVINPDDVISKFGADTLRVYEMFMGPIESDKPWDVSAVAGVYRFLNRIFDLFARSQQSAGSEPSAAAQRKLHQTIRKVTSDIPALKYNTAIAAMMELVNTWEAEERSGAGGLSSEDRLRFAQILAPFAPFLAEELAVLVRGDGDGSSIHLDSWPSWDETLAAETEITVPVQVNGRVRAKISVPADQVENQDEVVKLARADAQLAPWIEGVELKRTIYIPGKILNFVV